MDVDPQTGEVPDDGFRPEIVGPEYDALDLAIGEAERHLSELRDRRSALALAIRRAVGVNGTIAGQGANRVVVVPGTRGPQNVSRSGCERHAEQLLEIGLGAQVYSPPKIGEVRSKRAELVAAGIDLEEIAPTPVAGPPHVVVVRPKP